MQRKFGVLTLLLTGWEKKKKEPKSRKLPTKEKPLTTKKDMINATVDLWKKISEERKFTYDKEKS